MLIQFAIKTHYARAEDRKIYVTHAAIHTNPLPMEVQTRNILVIGKSTNAVLIQLGERHQKKSAIRNYRSWFIANPTLILGLMPCRFYPDGIDESLRVVDRICPEVLPHIESGLTSAGASPTVVE